GEPIRMEADGWVFDDFDEAGRPVAGSNDEQDVTVSISYLPNGDSVWDLSGDNPTVTYDKDGDPILISTNDGWVYQVDAEGNPIHGHNETLNLDVDISYHTDEHGEWQEWD